MLLEEMLIYWAQFRLFSSTTPRQEFQKPSGRYCVFMKIFWNDYELDWWALFLFFSVNYLMVICLGYNYFIAKLDLFEPLKSDYRESFCTIPVDQRDCGFFLYGNLIKSIYRVLRRILPRFYSPKEDDWDSLSFSDFVGKDLLENDHYMKTTGFRDRAF